MNTPWGLSQHIDKIGDRGIKFVSTRSHGGYLVPANIAESRIPAPVLNALFVGRYKQYYAFEEDCDSALFALYFPELCDTVALQTLPQTIKSMLNFCWSKDKNSHQYIITEVEKIEVINQCTPKQ